MNRLHPTVQKCHYLLSSNREQWSTTDWHCQTSNMKPDLPLECRRRSSLDASRCGGDARLGSVLGVPQKQRSPVELVKGDRVADKRGPVHLFDVQIEVQRIRAGQAEIDLAPDGLQPASVWGGMSRGGEKFS